jgi:hypothetical protein
LEDVDNSLTRLFRGLPEHFFFVTPMHPAAAGLRDGMDNADKFSCDMTDGDAVVLGSLGVCGDN